MNARVEKLARPAAKLSEIEKEKYIHDFICENIHYDKLKKPYSHEIIVPSDTASASVRELPNPSRSSVMLWESGA